MEVIKKINEMCARVQSIKEERKSIGFVPTMGAIHEGHISLLRTAGDENNKLIVSIFLNPIQFDNREDLNSYPCLLDKDIETIEKENVDIIFAPCTGEMYPDGFCTNVTQEKLTDRLCGRSRPGHFRGVTTVVTKLLNIIRPDRAYFGQKDYQQCIVVKRMVRDLNMGVEIRVLPTVRDKDGLAFSSRNRLLNAEERQMALCLYEALLKARSMFTARVKDTKEIIDEMISIIKKSKHVKVDYVSIVDQHTLEDVTLINGKAVAVAAIWVGNTRLIDNIILE